MHDAIAVPTSSPSALGGYADSFERFVDDVHDFRLAYPDQRRLATAVAHRLRQLLSDPRWLPPEYCEPFADRYRQHVLYVAPDGGYSVVSLVWLPGQETPIHNHVAWCVVGVYEGAERETRYHLYEDQADRQVFLVKGPTYTAVPGQTAALIPPAENIHRVTNCTTDRTISIHVYGADIGRLGSSINRCFDDVPVRRKAGGGMPITWRRARALRPVPAAR